MLRPDQDLEKDLNKLNVFTLPQSKISDKFFEGQYLGIRVSIAIPDAIEITAPEFGVSVINKRGVETFFTDWSIDKVKEQKQLSFSGWIRVPDDHDLVLSSNQMSMSFMDLCFYAGNEAFPEGYDPNIKTLKSNAPLKDIGWYYPSRFVDTMIDALGKLNDTLLSGQLEEAMLYGIISKKNIDNS